MIKELLTHNEFKHKPPVLVDVGASGALHTSWKMLAPYAICIAFDADERETQFVESTTAGYRRLYVFNKLVAESTHDTPFYLTKSPYCSSRLKPNQQELKHWAFSELFDIEKSVTMQATSVNEALNVLGLDYIDWFKTDSQGTDLRIFNSLPSLLRQKIAIAEFEPGIINAYEKEDFLFEVLRYMAQEPFWLMRMTPRGTQRISRSSMKQYFPNFIDRLYDFRYVLEESTAWAELTYMNTYAQEESFDKREYLLGCAIALSLKQYGFAIDLARQALTSYHDEVFEKALMYALSRMRRKIPLIYAHKVFNKIRRLFHGSV
ncbi:hypothetical protein [Sulfurospirillum sp. hDNRA2]|jgi:hypothetical protein|uniref:hypothetical protein n=1 Tax=Sulfurospirillum sp. hDNRA2 TaxID=3237298 RepID=UPI0020B75A20|nr:hypothetical protein [Sulfurospirillum sp. DNRA8]MCP3653170.1 hypothetical protein [Sulfurospirillum sp. DNRA8]MCR1812021.1 hypothetical protein [Sulfurospirillum sp. DNRA8]